MIAKLEFDFNNHDEKMEHFRCIKSLDMANALFEICLNLDKRTGEDKDSILSAISKIMDENNLNIEELIR